MISYCKIHCWRWYEQYKPSVRQVIVVVHTSVACQASALPSLAEAAVAALGVVTACVDLCTEER